MSIQLYMLALNKKRTDINNDWALIRSSESTSLYLFDRKTGIPLQTGKLANSSHSCLKIIETIISSDTKYSVNEHAKLMNLIFSLQSSMLNEAAFKIDASVIGFKGWNFELDKNTLTVASGTQFPFPLKTKLRGLELSEFRY
ncbi:hypothetical protein [Microbulbifer sp. SSSA005]|uniref:hypothetical protein n=1 Tax=Microbulbifer sp. SSSA005 TaxID=3243378 RepID=UPI00403962CC